MNQTSVQNHPSSYRDPSGFLFYQDGKLYRQVNKSFAEDFDLLMNGGLYEQLLKNNRIIAHSDTGSNLTGSAEYYRTILPETIPFISYPYEWCFDMLKDAALLTIELTREAMKFGMMLKDASSYNIQFHKGKMIFIDTLSFEKWDQSLPWIAYRQFCEHFLAPLALMHYLKEPFQQLLLAYPEGIPVAVCRKLLPWKSRFHLHTYLHLHLHGKLASRKSDSSNPAKTFSEVKMKNLLRSLEDAIRSFQLKSPTGVWSGYYNEALQREDYVVPKKEIIKQWIEQVQPETAIDLGANEGEFSTLLSDKNIFTISADFDHFSINNLYNKLKSTGNKFIHPVVMDMSHPSPSIGLNNEERPSFSQRVNTDLVMALALIHHLAIGKNIPFEDIAIMMGKMGKRLIIEFVPKDDEKIRLMLTQKRDVYQWYSEENFLLAFSSHFKIIDSKKAGSSGRTLYLMEAKKFKV